MPGTPVLHASGVALGFGGVTALDRVDVEVREEELLAIIGLDVAGERKSFREVKHYRRRKRWLG